MRSQADRATCLRNAIVRPSRELRHRHLSFSMSSARFRFAISDSMRAFRFSNIALRLGYAHGPSAHHPINRRQSRLQCRSQLSLDMRAHVIDEFPGGDGHGIPASPLAI